MNEAAMHRAFPPLIEGKPDILILGTFPSPLSREKSEYYGNPQNKFWRIIFDVFNVEFVDPSYDEKKNVLYNNGVALWDVVESCDIDGALDKNIKSPVYNAGLPEFIKSNGIVKVLFNGKTAYELYIKGFGTIEVDQGAFCQL